MSNKRVRVDIYDPHIHGLSPAQTAGTLDASVNLIYEGVRAGTIPSVRLGPRKIVIPASWVRERLGIEVRDA